MFDWLFGRAGRKAPAPLSVGVRRISARYDAAVSSDENRRHWANADALSPASANTLTVRKTLRERSRYEVANNSYAKGIILTLANDCIGTGPRLQMLTDDVEANKAIEAAFESWTAAVGLAEKLRTMRMSKAQDGEGFGILTTNPILPTPVKLDLRLLECDQVTDATSTKGADGILFDSYGNPATYTVRREHPGTSGASMDADKIPADSVLHFFRVDRPGQARGIPEIVSALGLFAQLRRYTLAVIGAAEVAADMAMVIQSDASADTGADQVEALSTIDLEKRMATVLPEGWKLNQTKAEQPATTYAEFKREILNEIARCLNVPFNVAAGNSSGYNYASGRLDHQVYFKAIRVEQAIIEGVILDRIFAAWLAEAVLVPDLIPDSMRAEGAVAVHQWFWDGNEHVDPSKEADAQGTRLANNTTNLSIEFAKVGRDWETEITQRGKEVAMLKTLGLYIEAPVPAKPAVPDEEDNSGDENKTAKGIARVMIPVNGRA
jgi:lambda family phage portal protein